MEFDFDEVIDRRAVPALKTHKIVLGEGGSNLFAAGVADMDFEAAPPILDALRERLAHGIFGYEAVPRGFSWSAFLLPSLWATWRGMGSTALALVAWSTLMFDVAKFSTRWYDDPAMFIGQSEDGVEQGN